MRTPAILCAFAVAFILLTVGSYTRKSATYDEPLHLTSGCMALKYRDYRVDPEHPPLLRMWAALPVLSVPGLRFESGSAQEGSPYDRAGLRQLNFSHQFLYELNDADRLLYRGRFMIVLLGIVLGVLIFSWARELYGLPVAAIVLGLCVLEPNILANSSLVTTDFGLACFLVGGFYFSWRTAKRITPLNVIGMTGFFALAAVSKFSAFVASPALVTLLAIRAFNRSPWPCALARVPELGTRRRRIVAAGLLLLSTLLVTWLVIWAVYRFRYEPSPGTATLFRSTAEPIIHQRVPALAGLIDWIDGHRLLPNAYSQGFLLGQARAGERTAFLLGNYSTRGWWYYFPIAIFLKTQLAVLLLAAGGLMLLLRRPGRIAYDSFFVLLPMAVFLGIAMSSHINIGLRHILPVYPLMLLLAGPAIGFLMAGVRRYLLAALCALCLLECAIAYPNFLTYFNLAVGGPGKGHRYLSDSNLDWGQDLKGLKKWMDANRVGRVNLSYFGTADPAYYGIDCIYLPMSPFFVRRATGRMALPGYVAVSATNLQGISPRGVDRSYYKPLLRRKPVAVIGHTIWVFQLDRDWNQEPGVRP